MAALYGKGVDNLLVEIDAEEIPILDGSSKNFIEAIDSAELEVSDQPIKIITIDREVVYEEGDKSISFKPSKISLEIDFKINFKNELIKTQKNNINIYMDDLSDMYNSRTFCLYEDIEKLKLFKIPLKGELTIVISEKKKEIKIFDEQKIVNKIKKYLKKYSLKDTVDLILETEKISKKKVYKAIILKSELIRDYVRDLNTFEDISKIVIGNGTTSREIIEKLDFFKKEIKTFEEKNTTFRAKARYFELFPIRGLRFLIPREIFILNKNLDAISALIILEDYCKIKFTLDHNVDSKTWLK